MLVTVLVAPPAFLMLLLTVDPVHVSNVNPLAASTKLLVELAVPSVPAG
ncbi:MAG: hypothetical protein ACTHK3_02485 [Solirubrobacterales bacterium]